MVLVFPAHPAPGYGRRSDLRRSILERRSPKPFPCTHEPSPEGPASFPRNPATGKGNRDGGCPRGQQAGGCGNPSAGDRRKRTSNPLCQRKGSAISPGHQPLRNPETGGVGLWPTPRRFDPGGGTPARRTDAPLRGQIVGKARPVPQLVQGGHEDQAVRSGDRGGRGPRIGSTTRIDHLEAGRRSIPDPAPGAHPPSRNRGAQPGHVPHPGLL